MTFRVNIIRRPLYLATHAFRRSELFRRVTEHDYEILGDTAIADDDRRHMPIAAQLRRRLQCRPPYHFIPLISLSLA